MPDSFGYVFPVSVGIRYYMFHGDTAWMGAQVGNGGLYGFLVGSGWPDTLFFPAYVALPASAFRAFTEIFQQGGYTAL